MILTVNPALKTHEGVVNAQPTTGPAPVSFGPHYSLIPASGRSAFNRCISKHEGESWLWHGEQYSTEAGRGLGVPGSLRVFIATSPVAYQPTIDLLVKSWLV